MLDIKAVRQDPEAVANALDAQGLQFSYRRLRSA